MGLVVCLAACSSPDLSALTPHIIVTDRLGASVEVDFDDDAPDLSIDATFRGVTVPLQPAHHVSWAYEAPLVLDPAMAADEPITIRIESTEMTITAPPVYDVVAPAPISRSSDASITLTNPGPEPGYWIALGCSFGSATIPANASSITFTPASWHDSDGGTCTTRLGLNRERIGTVDPAFAGGTLTFVRGVFVDVVTTP
jgi:hypothetical protein